ncbi:MAG: homoserine dehydrogenase [Vicinamibacterales bacterium]|nr:homoserine dehydrogenase [Vicinamibacterales bacterium]
MHTTAASGRVAPLRVAVLGFGTVGQSVVRILTERPELGAELSLTAIFNRNVAKKRAAWVSPSVTWTDDVAALLAARPDVVVETVGGVDLPYGWVSAALTQGISVVTANKLLLAAHAPELLALAAAHGARLRFEAAVAGGVPIIDAVRTGLAGDTITRVVGILNGTCNYILSRMTGGDSMADALGEAQRLGFAEADPTSDLDGHDAAAKLAVLVGVAFKRYIRTAEIPTGSIRRIDAIDFRYARRLGGTIRQLSMAECDANGSVWASVGPALVPDASNYARNTGPQNLVTLTGRFGGSTTFSGQGAGGHPTAVAVVSDLIALARQGPGGADAPWTRTPVAPQPARPYYLRFSVKDRPGILASITVALARYGINVDAVLQESGFPKDHLPFVVTVEPCEATALDGAMRDIDAEDFHAEPVLVLPVLPGE